MKEVYRYISMYWRALVGVFVNIIIWKELVRSCENFHILVGCSAKKNPSLCSRRLEEVGTRKNVRARRSHPSRVSLGRARPLFHPLLPSACYAGWKKPFVRGRRIQTFRSPYVTFPASSIFFLCFLRLVQYRLRNMKHCCVIFPYLSCSPPLSHLPPFPLPPPFLLLPPLFSWIPIPTSPTAWTSFGEFSSERIRLVSRKSHTHSYFKLPLKNPSSGPVVTCSRPHATLTSRSRDRTAFVARGKPGVIGKWPLYWTQSHTDPILTWNRHGGLFEASTSVRKIF